MESSKQTILLTGITGYLGSHVAKVILETRSHKYNLRASMREISEQKMIPLRNAFGDEGLSKI
jgi:thioester reductase-like protein